MRRAPRDCAGAARGNRPGCSTPCSANEASPLEVAVEEYLYATYHGWFEDLLEAWKNSGRGELCFSWSRSRPTTLPPEGSPPFWLYLYYSRTRTDPEAMRGVVKFRARVVEHRATEANPFRDTSSVFRSRRTPANARVWFRCDLVHELRRENGRFLHARDFGHADAGDWRELVHRARVSIPRLRRLIPIVVVAATSRQC